MTLQEKLQLDRNAAQQHTMVFFLEGKFYAGFESTAYIAVKVMPPLKVTCRYSKSAGQSLAKVGFPVASLPKYTAGMTIEQGEGVLTVHFPTDYHFNEEDFTKWKQSLPILREDEGPHPRNRTAAAVVERILQYPLESRTPLDAMIFIAELRRILQEK